MTPRSPSLRAERALQVFRVLFVSANWKTGLLVIVLLLSFNLASNAVYDMLKCDFHIGQGIALLLFFSLAGGLYWWARQASSRFEVVVKQEAKPQARKALVMFLSPPGVDLEWLKQELPETLRGGIQNKELREQFKASWRMPIEAIAYHCSRLEKTVIVPSSDSPRKLDQEPKQDGTFRHIELFKRIVNWIAEGEVSLDMKSYDELKGRPEEGVDFEHAQTLVQALKDVFDWLHEQGLSDSEILVDITGGQKVPTVAGAAMALGKGRLFQYVSTRDYKVVTYDVTYEAPADE